MITLHNTLTHNDDEFTPQDPNRVKIYTCGPTVYSEPHIGNWVAYIRWDILVRTLLADGFRVERVMNITDVGHLVSDADDGEDKMEKGARQEGISAWDVAARYTKSFLDGMETLNNLPADHLERATDHIAEQLDLIRTLKTKDHTYQISDGIYFDTSTFPGYGDFARLDLESLKAGARVEYNQEKRNPSDFALWKFSPTDHQRDMEWETPVDLLDEGQKPTKGFPGWHLECSAIALQYLGPTLDIHTGGIDHIPVHHTNEIAQSESATGKRFANFWLHCNYLLSDGTKLSKSLGNSYTLADLKSKGFNAMDFRMFILQSHYRTETNFTWKNLASAASRYKRWKNIANLRWQTNDTLVDDDTKDNLETVNGIILAAPHAALEALNADLNTPLALMHLERAFEAIENSGLKAIQHGSLVALLEWIDRTLGLKLMADTPDITDEQKRLITERLRAREARNWQLSDEIRDQLASDGIQLKDSMTNTVWSR